MDFADVAAEYWWVVVLLLVCVTLWTSHIRKKAFRDAQLMITESRAHLDQMKKDLYCQRLDIEASVRQLDKSKCILSEREHELSIKYFNLTHLVRERMVETAQSIANRDYLLSTPVFCALRSEQCDTGRLYSALTQDTHLTSPFQVSAGIVGTSGHTYQVSLESCTCDDFYYHKKPCKHMYRLAVELGALIGYDTSSISKQVAALVSQIRWLQPTVISFDQKLKQLEAKEMAIRKLLSESSQTYPWLSQLYADYLFTFDQETAQALRSKQPPAHRAAEQVNAIAQEKRSLQQKCKALEYQLGFYESLFPWLLDFKELPPTLAYEYTSAASSDEYQDEYKSLCPWISPEEYKQLPNSEKYQLALDRYQSRKKTNWDIGIEYERYIGYLCENSGCLVKYIGATCKLEDMGRDLLLTKDDKIVLIQCKRWAKEKQIHENHIFQLCGSVFEYHANHPEKQVIGVFVTSTQFSSVATLCAERLGIQLYCNIPYCHYPLIKCNISKTGEKIYHLPMDQQYDRLVISPNKGEFYAETIVAAESAGFRRANTWRSLKNTSDITC